MRSSSFRRHIGRTLVGFACILTIAGCGKSNPEDGTYRDASGMMTLYLHSGKADITAVGMTREAEYKTSGKTITVTWPNGHAFSTFTINSDGSLTGSTDGSKWTKS
jgi:hypothetical protein